MKERMKLLTFLRESTYGTTNMTYYKFIKIANAKIFDLEYVSNRMDLPDFFTALGEIKFRLGRFLDMHTIPLRDLHNCHTLFDKTVLNSYYDYDIESCNDCEEYIWRDDSTFIEGNNLEIMVCNDCCHNAYSYHEYDGVYYHNDDYPEDDYDEDDEYEGGRQDSYGMWDYSTDVTEHLPSEIKMPSDSPDEILSGLESEFEIKSNVDKKQLVSDIHEVMKDFAMVKKDTSLDYGGEIVTAPATLKAQKYRWAKFCESKFDFTSRIKSWHTTTSGVHIHIGRKFVTPLDIGKLLVFVNCTHNDTFITKIAGRNSDRWASKGHKTVKDGLERNDRYEAINNTKTATIEFRIFRGNLSKHGIFRYLEFVYALINFVKQSAYDVDTYKVDNLGYENFVAWVSIQEHRGMYPHLYKWLVKNSFTSGKTNTIRENEVNECA